MSATAPSETPIPTGGAPDFRVWTAGVEVVDLAREIADGVDAALLPKGADGQPLPRVRAVGSSTIQDLQGDTMELTALQDMAQVEPGLAIFVNHSYVMPEDHVGYLAAKPQITWNQGIADLVLDICLIPHVNPRAAQLFAGMKTGTRHGISVGCQVVAYEFRDAKTGALVEPEQMDCYDVVGGSACLHVLHVYTVEWSFVGIPANQRSWVQQAAKGLFDRTLDPLLAPIVRGAFPRDYEQRVRQVGDEGLRKALGEIPARPSGEGEPGRHLLWSPAQRTFLMSGAYGRTTALSRDQVVQLLQKAAQPMNDMSTVRQGSDSHGPMDLDSGEAHRHGKYDYHFHTGDADHSLAPLRGEGSQDYDKYQAARNAQRKGLTTMPGMTTRAASDEDIAAQKKRAAACGIAPKEGGNITCPSQWSSIAGQNAAWGDWTNFRYPMADKAHADNAAARWGDAGNRSQYTSEEQATITRRITARQRHFGEEPDEEKSMQPQLTRARRPQAPEVQVDGDGNHEPISGAHEHAHKAFGAQGDDVMHSHPHEHADDADHHHPHPEKSAVPTTTRTGATSVPADARPTDLATGGDQGDHGPFDGFHTHPHKAFGAMGADGGDLHAHEHRHQNDALHAHSHLDLGVGPNAGQHVTIPAPGPQNAHPMPANASPAPGFTTPGDYGGKGLGRRAAARKAGAVAVDLPEDAVTTPASTSPGGTEGGTDEGAVGGLKLVDALGNHTAFKGVHGHVHKAFGHPSGDAGDLHTHDHAHDGDTNHAHAHVEGMDGRVYSADAYPNLQSKPVSASAAPALLAAFNALGQEIGYGATAAEVLDKVACGLVATPGQAQAVRATVAAIDTQVDALLALLGVPDDDDFGGDADGQQTVPPSASPTPGYLPSPYYATSGATARLTLAHTMLQSALVLATKAGRRHSAGDLAMLQQIHDLTKGMTGGSVCKGLIPEDEMPTDEPAGDQAATLDEARRMGQQSPFGLPSPIARQAGWAPAFVRSAEALVTALGKVDLKAIAAQVAEAENRLGAVRREIDATQAQVRQLGTMPLPRPTAIRRALVEGEPGVATFADMLQVVREHSGRVAAGEGLALNIEQARARTTVKEVEGVGRCRHWPAGLVPRPALRKEQILAGLGIGGKLAYDNGDEAFVPILDEEKD